MKPSPSTPTLPTLDFPDQAAWTDWLEANRYAILFRIQNVKKAETRARKIVELTAMLSRGEKLHP